MSNLLLASSDNHVHIIHVHVKLYNIQYVYSSMYFNNINIYLADAFIRRDLHCIQGTH